MAKKAMSKKRLVGTILLVVGGILIGWGYNEARSVGGQLSQAISGSPSDRVLWFYISGAVCVLLGLFNVVKK